MDYSLIKKSSIKFTDDIPTAPENSVALGKLHLRVKYDSHLFDLAVHLIEAHNLCPIEEGGFRDPYVRLQLEPEVDARKRQTAIHRGEKHPYFDQNFKFPVSRDQLQGKELILQVYASLPVECEAMRIV